MSIPAANHDPAVLAAYEAKEAFEAFRSALDRVRAMDDDEIRAELATAARYNDVQALRAIEAVAIDENRPFIRSALRETNPDRMAAMDEWIKTRDLVEPTGTEALWLAQAFSAPRVPREVRQLPDLEEAEAKRRASVLAR